MMADITMESLKAVLRSLPESEATVRRIMVHVDDLHEMVRELRRVPGPHTGQEAVTVFESPNVWRGVAVAEMTDGTIRLIELRAGALSDKAQGLDTETPMADESGEDP